MRVTKLIIAAAFCMLASSPSSTNADVIAVKARLSGRESVNRMGYDPRRHVQETAESSTRLQRYMVILKHKDFASTVLDYIEDKSDDTEEPGAIVSKKKTWTSIQSVFFMKATGRIVSLLQTDEEISDMIESVEPDYLNFVTGNPTWGQDRIDQLKLPLNGKFKIGKLTGKGQCVYVIDTGVEIKHDELRGHAEHGYDFVSDDADSSDQHGHGTHCAGTVAGKTKGVAPQATIIGVRVLDENGSGYTSTVIAGVDWAVRDAATRDCAAVLSLSLGGGKDNAMNAAITDAMEGGVIPVVAAGNENRNACSYSPASALSAITVGSIDSKDDKSWFSNWGDCIDIFAPGSYIDSADYRDIHGYRTMSGTSMAAPHVAGAVALMLEENGGMVADKDYVVAQLLDIASRDQMPDEDLGYGGNLAPNLILRTPRGVPPGVPGEEDDKEENSDPETETCAEQAKRSDCRDLTGCYWNNGKKTCSNLKCRKISKKFQCHNQTDQCIWKERARGSKCQKNPNL